jgi:hypothetical protein
MFALNVNFYKSEVICLGGAVDKMEDYASIFTCVECKLPFKYQRVHMHNKPLRNSDWKNVAEKRENKALQLNFLSYCGMLILLKASLSILPLFMMYLYD